MKIARYVRVGVLVTALGFAGSAFAAKSTCVDAGCEPDTWSCSTVECVIAEDNGEAVECTYKCGCFRFTCSPETGACEGGCTDPIPPVVT